MTHILLYWNHICVLHRQEKAFLQELAGRLHRHRGTPAALAAARRLALTVSA